MKSHSLIGVILVAFMLGACGQAAASFAPSPSAIPIQSPLPSSTSSSTPNPTPTTASPSATAISPVYVTAFCTLIGKDPITTVQAGTPVVITWGWNAKTEAQINDFLENNLTTITLDGEVIDGVMTGGIQQARGLYEVVWQADVGVLPSGQHEVTYAVKWKKMIDDGTNTYGPGGQIETTQDACQIVVKG